MNAAAASPSPTLARAAWACLVLGWIALFVPDLRVYAGLPLAALGAVLALLAMRGDRRRALVPLLAALLVTPILYFVGTSGPMRGITGAAGEQETTGTTAADAAGTSTGPGIADPAAMRPLSPADTAMRTAVTAYELASTYGADPKAGDAQYKGQRLLVTGMVAQLQEDAVTLAAGDYPAVRAEGLPAAVRGTLREGQQISMACDGAGATDGTAKVDGCRMQ